MARKTKNRKLNKVYRMPRSLMGNPEKLLLSMDPGSRNFGLALVGLENGKPRCYMNSVMMRPVNDLVAFSRSRKNFLTEIAGWVRHQPDGLIAERFQTRGTSMGPLIEQVSAMIGLLGGTYPDLPIKLTIASAWKNSMNKRFDINLKEIYPNIDVQAHQLDASLIGIYGLEQGLGINIQFDLQEWITQVKASSLIGLRKRRN
jgi:hypothetical protein